MQELKEKRNKMRGIGYVEFLSVQKEIEKLLKEGHTISAIYRKLYTDKKITIGIKRFYAILSKRGLKKASMNQLKISKDVFNTSEKKDKNQKSLSHHTIPIHVNHDDQQLSAETDDSFGIIKKSNDEVF